MRVPWADVVGLSSWVLMVAGVFVVFGFGWALIALGAPGAALYLWTALREMRRVN